MRNTIKGEYIGLRQELRGKTAILMGEGAFTPTPGTDLIAQFDDRSLSEAFGWHGFKRGDFIVTLLGDFCLYDKVIYVPTREHGTIESFNMTDTAYVRFNGQLGYTNPVGCAITNLVKK